MIYSRHFFEMLKEREIKIEWVELCLSYPDKTDYHKNGTVHYLKVIEAFGNRILRVIVNNQFDPPKIITASIEG